MKTLSFLLLVIAFNLFSGCASQPIQVDEYKSPDYNIYVYYIGNKLYGDYYRKDGSFLGTYLLN